MLCIGEAVPAVDGNVTRVMARLRVIGAEAGSLEATQHIWLAPPTPQGTCTSLCLSSCRLLAEEAVDPERPGDFNQVLPSLESASLPAMWLLSSGSHGARCHYMYPKESILPGVSIKHHLCCLPNGVEKQDWNKPRIQCSLFPG